MRGLKTITCIALFFSGHLRATLLPGYYITSSGDTVKGNIQVEFADDVKDSVFYYELQYNILFANREGKVLLLRPSSLIREVGFTHNNVVKKLICVKRNETVGHYKLRKTEYIFAVRMWHGPIDIYALVVRRYFGIDYDVELCYYSKAKHRHVRDSNVISEIHFLELVEDCPEAMDLYKRNGAITTHSRMDLVYQYNKYCGQ